MRHFEFKDEDHRGPIERFEYTGAQDVQKYALVYLPYGYYEEPDRRYDILYLMHGGGGSPDTWMDSCLLKNMRDRCIASGEARPMIVGMPTFYATHSNRKDDIVDPVFEHTNVLAFQKEELEDRLIPALESRYRSFAMGTDPDSLRRSRQHRGFGGFSMGSVSTWYAFYLHADIFSVFLPLSGDCWLFGLTAGSIKAAETAQALRDAAESKGIGPDGFAIYAATGTEDIACPNLTPQIEAMKALDDFFIYSKDWSKGNFHFLLAKGLMHEYPAVLQYIYNYLPYLFLK